MSTFDEEINKAKVCFFAAESMARYDDRYQPNGKLTSLAIREKLADAQEHLIRSMNIRLVRGRTD